MNLIASLVEARGSRSAKWLYKVLFLNLSHHPYSYIYKRYFIPIIAPLITTQSWQSTTNVTFSLKQWSFCHPNSTFFSYHCSNIPIPHQLLSFDTPFHMLLFKLTIFGVKNTVLGVNQGKKQPVCINFQSQTLRVGTDWTLNKVSQKTLHKIVIFCINTMTSNLLQCMWPVFRFANWILLISILVPRPLFILQNNHISIAFPIVCKKGVILQNRTA